MLQMLRNVAEMLRVCYISLHYTIIMCYIDKILKVLKMLKKRCFLFLVSGGGAVYAYKLKLCY